jgi:hypothetical protein
VGNFDDRQWGISAIRDIAIKDIINDDQLSKTGRRR